MKLILGIANFDNEYGLSNKLKKKNFKKILSKLRKFKINEIDTATNYIESNNALSKLDVSNYKFNLKIPLIKYKKNFQADILNYINRFKVKIKTNKINTLMFHDRKQIYQKNFKYILKFIKNLKEKKIINRYGFSIYNLDEFYKIIKFCNPDIIQVPINIFDQRFTSEKINNLLGKKKIQLHARSIFLQGVLLNKSIQLNHKVSNIILKKYWNVVTKLKCDPLIFNLSFLLNMKFINKVIVSFDTEKQIKYFFLAMRKKLKYNKKIYKSLSQTNKNLILPYLWK